MREYEEKVLNYCSVRILPRGYTIDNDVRRKLLSLVKDAVVNYSEPISGFGDDAAVMREVIYHIARGRDIDGWICEACVNADYLTEDEKVLLLSTMLRRKKKEDKRMIKKCGFALSPPIPYQLCLSYLLEHEPLTHEYLFYLLLEDRESPKEYFIHNFRIMLDDRNLNDYAKILYWLCLPRIAPRRDVPRIVPEVTAILLDSEAIAQENRVMAFELLREPRTFDFFRTLLEEMGKGNDIDEVPPFLDTLLNSIWEMPVGLQAQFLYNLCNVYDFDFNCVRRDVCTWYISQLPTLEEKKKAVVQLLENGDEVKSSGEGYIKKSAYDALYSLSADFDADFVRQLLERGLHASHGDIRAHCYQYLLLLFDDATYVERCLSDTAKKVRETVVRTALSGAQMDPLTRLRLSRIIEEKNLKLTKKQKGRLKNLLKELPRTYLPHSTYFNSQITLYMVLGTLVPEKYQ